jgi:hypothetical protein
MSRFGISIFALANIWLSSISGSYAQNKWPDLAKKMYGTAPAPSIIYNPWRSHYWPYQDFGFTHMYGATY